MNLTTTTRAYLGWLLVLLAVLAALLLTRDASAQSSLPPDVAAMAEETFARACATCHGGAGQGAMVPGTDREAPALAGRDDVTVSYVDLTLRTGRMPPPRDPFDNRAREVAYDDEQRQALVTWMAEEFDLQGDVPEVEEGDIAVGFEVYALNCAHCHGNTGAGGVAGAGAFTPRVSDRDPVAVVEAIRVGPFEMPAFGEDVISEEEANGIASFLEEVDSEAGTPLFGLVELNPVFAAAFVALLAVAMIFSLMFIAGRPREFELVAGAADRSAVTGFRRSSDPNPGARESDPGPSAEGDVADADAGGEAADDAEEGEEAAGGGRRSGEERRDDEGRRREDVERAAEAPEDPDGEPSSHDDGGTAHG